ncbi:MAG: DctP family TRAP transporter solute-binding subunit [SAR324 cluster bacterium]|nr:DctP family TRAP transporter solute-binding subunit [SAR324 cluster bacterium]
MKIKYLSGVLGIIAILVLIFFMNRNPVKNIAEMPKPESQTIQLQFGHNMPVDSAIHQASLKFAELVKTGTSGKITIQVSSGHELGSDEQMLEKLLMGELPILVIPTAKMATLYPPSQFLDLPFLFENEQEVYALMDGPVGKQYLKGLESKGLQCVTFWGNGFKQFIGNKSLNEPEAFKDLRVRTMKSNLIMDQFRQFGANPIPLEFSRVYEALRDGVVDAQENPLAAVKAMKFYEVEKHITLSNHAYLAYAFCFNQKKLKELAPEAQSALIFSAQDTTPLQRQWIEAGNQEDMKDLEQLGVIFHELDEANKMKFRKLAKPLWDSYQNVIGETLWQGLIPLMKNKHETGDQWIIALNADLSSFAASAGLAIKRGMELAIDEINDRGGVLGKKLGLLELDHVGIPARGQANVQQASVTPNVVAIMGGLHSGVIYSELPLIHELKIPYLVPWGASNLITDTNYKPSYVFRLSARDEYVAQFMASYAMKHYNRIGLILENTDWGRSNHESILAVMKKSGNSPASIEWFDRGNSNLEVQISRSAVANVDVLIMVANVVEGAAIINEIARRENSIPVLSHWGISGGDFFIKTRESLKKVSLKFIQTYSFVGPLKPEGEKLREHYLKKYNILNPGQIPSPVGTAHAYDLIWLLKQAMEQAGSAEPEKIRQALESMPAFEGVTTTFQPPFTPERHEALDSQSYIWTVYDAEGNMVPAIQQE